MATDSSWSKPSKVSRSLTSSIAPSADVADDRDVAEILEGLPELGLVGEDVAAEVLLGEHVEVASATAAATGWPKVEPCANEYPVRERLVDLLRGDHRAHRHVGARSSLAVVMMSGWKS